jgi:sugar lactone lactonase YvrE
LSEVGGLEWQSDLAQVGVPEPMGFGHDTLGECPTWWPEKSRLCWVDVRGCTVRVLDFDTGLVRDIPTPEKAGGMCLTDGGRLLLAMEQAMLLLDPDTGERELLAGPPHAGSNMRFNELKVDPAGRVFVGYMNDVSRSDGYLYRIGAGRYEVVLDRVAVPNSLAWSPDGATMYFADGVEPVIWAFDFDVASGRPANRREFARVEMGVPDGAAVDVDGGLWSAVYGGSALIRFGPDGHRDREIQLPVSQPTCPAFAGPGLDRLYCMSASQRLSAEELAAQPLAGEVFVLRLETPGVQVARAAEALLPRTGKADA